MICTASVVMIGAVLILLVFAETSFFFVVYKLLIVPGVNVPDNDCVQVMKASSLPKFLYLDFHFISSFIA